MAKKPKKLNLGELETLVMKEVWKRGRATAHQVRDAIESRRNLAYTTILTTLQNLEKKGFLNHDIEGRANVYYPTVEAREVQRSVLHSMLDVLFDGSKAELVNTLFEEEPLSKSEFESLRKRILKIREEEKDHE